MGQGNTRYSIKIKSPAMVKTNHIFLSNWTNFSITSIRAVVLRQTSPIERLGAGRGQKEHGNGR
jgi:hypothetical protein